MRREVALSLRDQPADKAMNILVDIARGFDGQDRSYLEAFGTGATSKEAALYDRLRTDLGVKDALTWSPAFARIAWRLHVPAAVPRSDGARDGAQALGRRASPGDGHARVHQRPRGVEGDADARREG